MEEQSEEGMPSRVSNSRLQSETELSGRSKGCCRTCQTRQRQFLATQISRDVRDTLSLGRWSSFWGLGHNNRFVFQPSSSGETYLGPGACVKAQCCLSSA